MGCLHEFSSINGVREDVTDIVLSVKKIIFKADFSGIKETYFRKKWSWSCYRRRHCS